MPSVSRTFTVDAEARTVLTYLADFGNAEQWDPGTESCTRNDDGPVRVGSSWHNVSKIAGVSTELTYTLEKQTDDTLVFVGRNDSATSTDTIEIRPATGDASRSELTYTADLEMKGAAKLAAPAMKLVFEKLAGDTEKQLTEVLAGLG